MKNSIKKLSMFVAITLLIIVYGNTSFAEIKVYDAGNQYLGILVSYGGNLVALYDVNTKRIFEILLSSGQLDSCDLYYESNDCSGDPFLRVGITNEVSKNNDKFYTGSQIGIISARNINSRHPHEQSCMPYNYVGQTINAVEVPSDQIPFTLPVVLPLRFEYFHLSSSVPAVTPGGLTLLFSLLAGAGFWQIFRKRKMAS